jgi:hypothetical protein
MGVFFTFSLNSKRVLHELHAEFWTNETQNFLLVSLTYNAQSVFRNIRILEREEKESNATCVALILSGNCCEAILNFENPRLQD